MPGREHSHDRAPLRAGRVEAYEIWALFLMGMQFPGQVPSLALIPAPSPPWVGPMSQSRFVSGYLWFLGSCTWGLGWYTGP